jgi:hypothetical protein
MADTPASMDDLQNRLAALRASGADRRDPVRFVTLEALARRATAQPESIRQPLLTKLNAMADQLATSPTQATQTSAECPTPSPLTELLTYINQHAHAQPSATQAANESAAPQGNSLAAAVNPKFRPNSQTAAGGRSRQGPELKSVAYFRNEWSKLSTEQQLTKTLAQAPENAGPMNSQHLVLRSLQVMRDIAPDYLQGFMSYIDTLIWLEHVDAAKRAAARSTGGEGETRKRTVKRSGANR